MSETGIIISHASLQIEKQRKAKRLVDNEVRQCMSYAHSEMIHYIPSYQSTVYEALESLDFDRGEEIYEVWSVSPWLARQLDTRGEIVWEWAGVSFWGRMTTGQAIYIDHVIEQITNR